MADRFPGFVQRTALAVGWGTRTDLPRTLESLGASQPVLLIDPALSAGVVGEQLRSLLPAAPVVTCDPGEPTFDTVAAAADALRAQQPDGIVAVGGGSTLDTGKLARGLLASGASTPGEIPAELGAQVIPLVAMPTTAGTGAEVGAGAIVYDPGVDDKVLIRRQQLAADVAIADAELTVGLPSLLTAYTGLDAFAQALMAYVAAGPDSISGRSALTAMELIHGALPPAVADGADEAARSDLMLGSVMSALAMYSAPPTYAGEHVFAEPVGPVLGAHHGHAVAALLPGTAEYNAGVLADRFAEVAQALRICDPATGDPEAAQGLTEELRRLVHSLDVPPLPGDRAPDLDTLVERCKRHDGYRQNPRPLSPEAAGAILAGAFDGSFSVASMAGSS